jgi:hypothetical protein
MTGSFEAALAGSAIGGLTTSLNLAEGAAPCTQSAPRPTKEIEEKVMSKVLTSRARMGGGVQHPVPVRIFCWPAGRLETVLAVNYAAAQELVQKINGEKGTERHACIGKVGEPAENGRR